MGKDPVIIEKTYLPSFSSVYFFALANAKHDNIIALHIEDHTIITNAKSIAADFRVGQTYHGEAAGPAGQRSNLDGRTGHPNER